MNRLVLALVATATLVVAAPALGKCPEDIEALSGHLRLDTTFQQGLTGRSIDGSAYERLFEAARIFAGSSMEQRCQAVLDGIREMASKDGVEASTLTREGSGNVSRNMNRSR